MAIINNKSKTTGSSLTIIGPRGSGKTTFLAGLAYWLKRSEAQKIHNSPFKVEPLNDDAEELERRAINLIESGQYFEGDDVKEYLPTYSFRIEIKQRFSAPQTINLVAKDYPGEMFDDLAKFYGQHQFDPLIQPKHRDFWEECFLPDKHGCLILLSGWTDDNDRLYQQCLNGFIELMNLYNRSDNFRLAVAMSMCERGELWTGRIDPEIDLFGMYLPQTRATLTRKIPSHNLQFFAISTFGVLDRKRDPRPNREIDPLKKNHAVLRKPKRWQPYNLIEPLSWLSKN